MSSFNQEAYDRAVARRDLAQTDLEELAQQIEDGEIDEDTAAGLRAGYEAELAAAQKELAQLGSPPSPKKKAATAPAAARARRAPSEQATPARTGFNKRWLVGAGILVVAMVVILISVQNSSEPDPVAGGTMPGTGTGADPCAEMAEAVDLHPGNALRLALADCYTETGNAMSAIEHFRTVADSTEATPQELGRANVGLGYLNLQIGEVEKSADYMRTALDADPTNVEGQYFLGMLLIYDLGDPTAGVPLLESVLEAPNLPEAVVLDIQEAISVAQGSGGAGS